MPSRALRIVVSFLLDLAHVLTRSDHDQALDVPAPSPVRAGIVTI